VIPGHEYVGEIVDTRLRTKQLKVGDTVVYWGQTDFGGLAEFRVIRPLCPGTRREEPWFTTCGFVDGASAAAVVLDNGISLNHAPLLEPLTAVLRALLMHPPRPGESAMVLGAGPCGLLALQLLKKVQAAHSVTVLDTNPERLTVVA
jgi:L-iditol 2-dehydrogenase/threonine 3-dehydrogenase